MADHAEPIAAARVPTTRERLFRMAAQYSVGTLLAMTASIARVGVTARMLSDSENGVWLGLQLLLNYAGNLHLGSLYGMFRSVPMLRARGDDAAAEEEKRNAFAFVLIMIGVGALGILAIAPRLSRASSMHHVLLTVVLLAVNLLRAYWTSILKAESRFKELSVGLALGAGATVICLLLVARFRLDGLLVGMLLQAGVEVSYMAWVCRPPKPRIVPAVLKAQLRVGLMTLGTTLGVLALSSGDRAIMLRMLGAKATGTYYLGANILLLMPMLMLIPVGVLTPSFFERVGKGEDLLPLVDRPMRAMGPVQAWICASLAVALPSAVHVIWPHHAPGVPAAIAALFGTYPLVLSGLVTNVYYALDRQGIHVLILGLCATLGFALAAVGIHLTGGIVGAAAGQAAALGVYFVVTSWAAMRLVPSLATTHARATRQLLGRAIVPIAWAAVLLAGVWLGLGEAWRGGSIAYGLVAEAIVALGFAPFVPAILGAFRGRHASAA